MTNDIRQWLVGWFERRNPGIAIDCQAEYYTMGWVDSFGIIELIDAVEGHFGVTFADSDFKDRQFRSIDGLTRLVQLRSEQRSSSVHP